MADDHELCRATLSGDSWYSNAAKRKEGSMSGSIVYVDRSEIVEGRLGELTDRMGELVALIEANEPRLIAYNAYLNEDQTEISVVHIHRDVASMVTHFKVAGPAFRNFVDLVHLQSIDIYGDPTDELVDQLREKARMLGNATVSIHPYQAGFIRQ
jgi:hypothetical protein